jgi:hypothetical protein
VPFANAGHAAMAAATHAASAGTVCHSLRPASATASSTAVITACAAAAAIVTLAPPPPVITALPTSWAPRAPRKYRAAFRARNRSRSSSASGGSVIERTSASGGSSATATAGAPAGIARSASASDSRAPFAPDSKASGMRRPPSALTSTSWPSATPITRSVALIAIPPR